MRFFLIGVTQVVLPAMAQEFPKKRPIKLFVAFRAGGLTDALARTTVELLQRRLGQAVVVEKKLGAAFAIGADYVSKSPADGYTLCMAAERPSTHVQDHSEHSMTPTNTPPTAEGCIDTEVVDNILLIGINRPAKRNGMTPRMLRQLAEAYTRLDDDAHLRVGVLYAVGEHFTGGMDLPALAEYQQRGERPVRRDQNLVEPHDLGLPGYRRRIKPMVAAVKGICFTAGVELMLAADVVIAADNCRFAQMEVSRGILAAGGATVRMAQRAGVGNALHLLLTGMEFDSVEAHRLSFVQKVVPSGEEFGEALAVARRIAAQAPLAVAATRLNVRKAIEEGPLCAVAELVEVQQRLSQSEDAAEGRKSFIERRSPVFTGR